MQKHHSGAVRTVMDMSVFVLILLSGLLHGASGLWREYHHISQNMTWSTALSYCREKFTDLATVDSMNDVNRMINTVNDGYSGSVWIGLKRVNQSRWGWSMGDDTLTQYGVWGQGYPSGTIKCGYFDHGTWRNNVVCSEPMLFACYNESIKNIMIRLWKNWTDAQSYCRQHYTDLAIARSPEEQQQMYTNIGSGPWVWIGLNLDFWQWSDQWSLFFRNWAAGQHFQSFGDCVAMSTTDPGKWIQYSCDQQHPFICYGEDKQVNKQIVRLMLSHDGKKDLRDPGIQTAILNEINIKLKSMGLGGYKSISWRKDEGGEVFHLMKTTVKSSKPCDLYPED